MKDFFENSIEQVDELKDHFYIDHENLFDDIDKELEDNTAFWITMTLVVVLIIIAIIILKSLRVCKKNKRKEDSKSCSEIEILPPVSATSAMPVSGSTVVELPVHNHEATAPISTGKYPDLGLGTTTMHPPSYDSAMNISQDTTTPYNPSYEKPMKY